MPVRRSAAVRLPCLPRHVSWSRLTTAVLLWFGWVVPAAGQSEERPPEQADLLQSYVSRYCVQCHGGGEPKAELPLDELVREPLLARHRDAWEAVADMIEAGEMPPEDQPQPEAESSAEVVAHLRNALAQSDCRIVYPGRVTLRRLNRREYNNTIRDLLGLEFQPADDFPADDVGYGFDNIGDVLSMPPLLVEKYLDAAETIIDRAWDSPESLERILICRPGPELTPEECARRILAHFAGRAFRRPATDEEVRRLMQLAGNARDNGLEGVDSLRVPLTAVLVSPHFLFRIEQDPDEGLDRRLLNDYEIASRLSYFLWSSMPDEELFALAAEGRLQAEDELERQVDRMLEDPRAIALVENFAGQWLQLRRLETLTPDPARFPDFDEPLRQAMRRETELLFLDVMENDRSILDFLQAGDTFVNERLARHYGIDGVEGEAFQRVEAPGPRRGVLMQASILTLTSNPTRTSPVKRGQWVLDNLLGTPPPPPPPGVAELEEEGEAELLGTLRERMEQHRTDANCAVCHRRMDPLGFGLENFDAVGAWREQDGRFPIDPSGELPGGITFEGPEELVEVLTRERRDEFCRCLSRKMLTYALGRGLEWYDYCAEEDIMKRLAAEDYRFRSLVKAVVISVPFRYRGASEEGPP